MAAISRAPHATPAERCEHDAVNIASSIVRLSSSSCSRRSHRTANRDRRSGSFSATRAVSASASSSLIRPSSRAVASATTMFPRSIAVAKIRRGCPLCCHGPPGGAGRLGRLLKLLDLQSPPVASIRCTSISPIRPQLRGFPCFFASDCLSSGQLVSSTPEVIRSLRGRGRPRD